MKRIFATKFPHVFAVAFIAFSLLLASVPMSARAEVLTRELQVGMSGADVSALQTFLAKDPTLYPEGRITGYFGSMTKAAVARFQTRNGLPAVGRVGPATLPVLNAQMGATVQVAPISNPSISLGTTGATVSFSTQNPSSARIYYSASPFSVTESLHDVTVAGANVASVDANLRTAHSIPLANLTASTTYYYMVYTMDASGNVNVTFPTTLRTNQ